MQDCVFVLFPSQCSVFINCRPVTSIQICLFMLGANGGGRRHRATHGGDGVGSGGCTFPSVGKGLTYHIEICTLWCFLCRFWGETGGRKDTLAPIWRENITTHYLARRLVTPLVLSSRGRLFLRLRLSIFGLEVENDCVEETTKRTYSLDYILCVWRGGRTGVMMLLAWRKCQLTDDTSLNQYKTMTFPKLEATPCKVVFDMQSRTVALQYRYCVLYERM